MSRTDRAEPPRPYDTETKVYRRTWHRRARALARSALRRGDHEAAEQRLRRTQGWMTW
ncbi:MAG TPA: hypothetical protein VFL99_16585 [Segeticoccus sp.]|uniref:hypothetical protein n=1 Tax=Segeticoccus sp. TaxID=2706531 RepID=UPI002D80E65A|nr:hypothetical protein [Segeticoccus sp.]HET8601943.1 hypothetical protein [Segeticoccus sp.]